MSNWESDKKIQVGFWGEQRFYHLKKFALYQTAPSILFITRTPNNFRNLKNGVF